MKRELTICGIALRALKWAPEASELGSIVASLSFEAQAEFLSSWSQALRDTHAGRGEAYQITRIAEAARALDEELGDDYVAGFVADLNTAIENVLVGEAA